MNLKNVPSIKSILLSRAVDLRLRINEHNDNYYNKDAPIISDADYDLMMEELINLETESPWLKDDTSPTVRIGGKPNKEFKLYKHLQEMYSLDNGFNKKDLTSFVSRIINEGFKPVFYADPKYDGLAISLTYKNGILIKAATRGDGEIGEDVTDNARTIKTIPLLLTTDIPPGLIEIRGEVVMLKSVFDKLNAKQKEIGGKEYVNTRNAAAGALRQLDSKETAARELSFICYGVGFNSGFNMPSYHHTLMNILSSYGLPTVYTYVPDHVDLECGADNLEQMELVIDCMHRYRDKFPFGIDGVVFKLDDLEAQKKLGWHSKAPRFALAFKFPAEEKNTVVLDIISQIGRSGVLYPVAILKPIFVGGVTVSRATLHNISETHNKDIRIGDTVVVRRAGDVVPEIVMSIKVLRPANSKVFNFPSTCPSCNLPTITTDDGKYTFCINYACPGQLKRFLEHFVKRDAMDIENVGPSLIEKLIDINAVRSTVDLFKLTIPTIMICEGIQQKSAEKIYNSIQSRLNVPLDRFLYSFGADGIGRTISKKLADKYQNLDAVLQATPESLLTMFDTEAAVSVKKIISFINSDKTKELVKAFLEVNLVPYYNSVSTETNTLKGKTFVLSGSFGEVTKSDIENEIILNGGIMASGVSSKNQLYLIAGDGAGTKLIKANSLGVPILSLSGFKDMLSSKKL